MMAKDTLSFGVNNGPPLSPQKCWPFSVNSITSTEPSGPGPSLPLRMVLMIFESLNAAM